MADLHQHAVFYCPHCGTENPPFEFAYTSGGNAHLQVAYVTTICGGIVPGHVCADCGGRGTVILAARLQQCAGCKGTRLIPERSCRRVLGVGVVGCQVFTVPQVG
jgi:hypothetical protein